MTVAEIKKSFQNLSLEDRLLLLHDLWDDVAADDAALELSTEERAELERRYGEHVADPSTATKWEHVRTEIRSRH